MKPVLIDTHAHLTDERLAANLDDVLAEAREAGVVAVINAGYNMESSRAVFSLARNYSICYGVVGIQPSDAPQALGPELDEVAAMLTHPKVVGIGEIGLDYYWNRHPRDVQVTAFSRQIELASAHGVPFVVHDRDAHGDILEVLRRYAPYPAGFVMHCFSGSPEMAEICVKLGGHISLAGPVTFKNAVKPAKVAASVPLDRLLIETDCPYLTPHPYRGQLNRPGYLPLIAQRIAELKGLTLSKVAAQTTANARAVFGLKEASPS
ncbi:MAG TPA: TatD family hydrolase [Bacillota bacterium]|nr:TatD family hydrolase [Bacillota bacterium]